MSRLAPGTKTLDEGDRAGVGCTPFQPRLLEQETRDDAVNDSQHRREQLGMSCEQNTQNDNPFDTMTYPDIP